MPTPTLSLHIKTTASTNAEVYELFTTTLSSLQAALQPFQQRSCIISVTITSFSPLAVQPSIIYTGDTRLGEVTHSLEKVSYLPTPTPFEEEEEPNAR